MKLQDYLRICSAKLLANSISSAVLDARLIFCFVLDISITQLLTTNSELTSEQYQKITKLIDKRCTNFPLAYITNHKEFYGLEYYVDQSVLIPRPESESIIEYLRTVDTSQSKIYDIGTGSGCLAITAKKLCPNCTVYAVDISKEALNVAQKNARKLDAKINFVKSDLLAAPILQKSISDNDIILANLPYVKESQDNQSIAYEPRIALFSHSRGLGHYYNLFDQIKQLSKKLTVIIEHDPSQSEELFLSLRKSGTNHISYTDYVTVIQY